MTYYVDLPDIDLKLYKIGTLHGMIMFLTIQEEFRRFVMAASSYAYHFTSPQFSLLINNAETTAATHEVLASTNILKSNGTIKWTFSVECPLLI